VIGRGHSSSSAKVLFVNLEGNIAGGETSLLSLMSHLKNHYCLAIACPANSALAYEAKKVGIDHLPIPTNGSRRYHSLWWVAFCTVLVYRLWRICLKQKPQIVHANSIHSMYVSILAAIGTGAALVWHVRDVPKIGFVTRMGGHFCGRIVAVSYMIRNSLLKHGVKAERTEVIYNGIEVKASQTVAPGRTTWRRNQVLVFGNVGQFVPWKRQLDFLMAACQLRETIPTAHFLLVGDDLYRRNFEYKQRLETFVTENHLEAIVHRTGWTSDMDSVWSEMDCLVHTAEQEPFGRVIIEAMAAGIPVIAINSGGPSEIIQHRKTGILVEPGNIRELVDAMKELALDATLRSQLATSAQEYAIQQFPASKTAEQVHELYQDVLRRTRRSA